jgi:N-acetylglutamate synthase-like GNAT family acetyltransferase
VTDRERAVAFLLETYRRRAKRVESFEWGELVVTPSLPRVWDANFAVVERWKGSATSLRREMNRAQGGAGFAHRRTVIPHEEVALPLWEDVKTQGWDFASRYVLMVQRRPPDRAADPSVEVLRIGDVDWARGRRAMIESEPGGEDTELGSQLLELDRRLARATDVRHLAAVVHGEVASYAGLYLEDDVAQIEDVATLPWHRNRGLARAVVLHAAVEARRAGAELVFLVAAEADWPKELYSRLGFDTVGVEHVFGRSDRQHSSA